MSIARQVEGFTRKRIAYLLNSSSDSAQRAALANLRRGVGRHPSNVPQLWGEVLHNMPEELYSQSGEPSYAEWAVYTALTLFALHQQGKNTKDEAMHREEVSLGRAVAGLVSNDDDRERIWKRFVKVVTAGDMTELSYHLRGIVQLLKANGIALDYALLAKDLFLFQTQEYSDGVKLRWGQDFYRIQKKDENTEEEADEQAQ